MFRSTRTISLKFLSVVALGLAGCQGTQRSVCCEVDLGRVQRLKAGQVVRMLDEQFDAGEAMTPVTLELYCSYLHRSLGGQAATEESAIAYRKRLDELRDQITRTYDGNKQLAYIIDYYANLEACTCCGRMNGDGLSN